MKHLFRSMLALSTLLAVGSAASQDAVPSRDAISVTSPARQQAADVDTMPPELQHLAGNYTLTGDQTDSAAMIKTAIDTATANMNGLKKSVARKRLEAVNKVVARINISGLHDKVTVAMNDYAVTAPLDGSAVAIKTPSGETAKASFLLKTATLVQDIDQTKGRRENAFRLNSEGNMVMQVRETSPRLASAVSYSLVFKRVEQ